jgi:hypothetical protein
MVTRRVARLAAQRVAQSHVSKLAGTPADTAASAQAIQDALWRRTSPAEKLAAVARLSRMVEHLAVEGIRRRHPIADAEMIRLLRNELRLGQALAATVDGEQRKRA